MPCRCVNSNDPDIQGGTCGGGNCGSKQGKECTSDSQCQAGGGQSGGGGMCFQGGTKIEIPGGFKSIESIEIGDIVKSYDTENNEVVESKVYDTFEHKDNDNGLLLNGIIKTTTNHPFYSDGQWIEAGDLNLGDKILHVDGEEHTITSIEPLNYSATVYNFEVKDTHNYFAEGYLVHNKGAGGGGGGGHQAQAPEKTPGMSRIPYLMGKPGNPYRRGGPVRRPKRKFGRGGMMRNNIMSEQWCQPWPSCQGYTDPVKGPPGGNQLMSENCCACLRGRAGVVCDMTTCTCHEFIGGAPVRGGSGGGQCPKGYSMDRYGICQEGHQNSHSLTNFDHYPQCADDNNCPAGQVCISHRCRRGVVTVGPITRAGARIAGGRPMRRKYRRR